MGFKVGDKVKILNTEFGNQGRVGTITTISGTVMIYLVEIVGAFGKDCQWSNASDLELVTEEETSMKFKVGDKVRVKDSWFGHDGDIGTIVDYDGEPVYPFLVEFDVERQGGKEESFNEESLELIEPEEEKVMKFKVGDKVTVVDNQFGNKGKVGEITNIMGMSMPYYVSFGIDGGQWSESEELELVKEEEKVMEFKVGDKVKVSNSLGGRSGEVGEIVKVTERWEYKHNVSFDDDFEENFKEEELELVKEKQQFTKSDLKTGMGVVLRDGTKGHVLLGTEAGDVIRFINGGSNQWASVDEYDENMIDCDISAMDIVEVYSSRYAYACLTDRVFNQDCVFKREEPKSEPKSEPEPTKMTMKEINEHFGKAIEIVE